MQHNPERAAAQSGKFHSLQLVHVATGSTCRMETYRGTIETKWEPGKKVIMTKSIFLKTLLTVLG